MAARIFTSVVVKEFTKVDIDSFDEFHKKKQPEETKKQFKEEPQRRKEATRLAEQVAALVMQSNFDSGSTREE